MLKIVESSKMSQEQSQILLTTEQIIQGGNGTTMMPHDLDDSKHNAFYYAIRSGNMDLLKTLITDWPGSPFLNNLEILDDILSKAYDELKLKNIPLSEEIKVFVESQLIDLRFFSNTKELTENSKPLLDNIKERIRFVVENIDLLSDEYSDEPEIDDRFLFLAKCIAQNIFVLKRQLRSTYKSLPWEEIEFCLICFSLSYITHHKHNIFYHAVLNKGKLLKYLDLFSKKLQEKTKLLDRETCNLPKHKSREEIVANIIRECPQFEELYNDHQQIRDIHSLTKMNEYIELSLQIDPKQKQGQLVITRALTVIGEHTKNTLESPKLSKDTNNLLLFSLSSNTHKILTGLRNSLTHAGSLYQRENIENNKDVSFFIGIQQDCEQLRDLIADILYQSKIKIIKLILKEIVDDDNLDRIGELAKTLTRFEDDISSENPRRNLEKIKSLVAKLRRTRSNPTDWERKEFKNVDDIIVSIESHRLISNSFKHVSFLIFNIFAEDKNIGELEDTKLIAKLILKYISLDENTALQPISSYCINIYKSLRSRMQTDTEEFQEISKLILNIDFICNFGTNDVKFIKEFKNKLTEKAEQNINCTQAKDKFPKDQIDLKLIELGHELEKWIDGKKITESYLSYKCDSKLQAVVEVLVLDMLTILSISKTCVLENNFLSFADNCPLLAGKSLRNHLAHDNGLVDLLMSDPSISIVLNANKLITEDLTSITNRKRLGKTQPEDLTRVRTNYDWGVAIISNQRQMFGALQSGSLDDLLCCLKEGADVYARCFRMRTALIYAAIGGSLEIVKYLFDENVLADAKDIHGKTVLHVAAEYGRTDIVKFLLLNRKVFIDELTELNETPLHLAAEKGHKEIVEILLDYKANMNIQNVSGLVALQKAVIHNQKDVVETLLKKGGKDRTVNSLFLLHLASKSGNLDMAEYLLKKGASVSATNNDKETPLHIAARHGHLVVVDCLIKNKAKVNRTDKKGLVPLHFAAQNGHVAVVETLIKHGANINFVDAVKNTPLNYAIAGGHENVVDIFLKNRVKTGLLNEIDSTPLHCAVLSGNLNIITALLKSRVKVNFRDKRGNTPLHILACKKHSCPCEIAERMLKNGADINARNQSNLTPLHLAASSGNTELMECLVTYGADVNARDSDHATALHMAVSKDNIGAIKILVKNKALVDAKDKNGWTTLMLAAAKGYTKIVKYLLENNAEEKDTDIGESALGRAIAHGKVDVVEVLLKHKSQINYRGILDAALLLAVNGGHKDIVEILFANGANFNQNTEKDLVCCAIQLNRLEIFKLLVSKGASVDGERGEPIAQAVSRGHNDIVEYLLEHKASLNAKILGANENLLKLAVSRGHKDVVSTLIRKGADVNATSLEGFTSLHVSVAKGYNEITNILIENGANVNVDCGDGTSLHIAVADNNFECVKILINSGKADMNIKTRKDYTILHVAAEQGNLEMVKYLVKSGSDINAKLSNDVHGSKAIHLAAKYGFKNILEFFINIGLRLDEPNLLNETPLHLASRNGHFKLVKYLILENAELDTQNCIGLTPLYYAALSGHKNVVELLLHNGAMYNVIGVMGRKVLEQNSCSEIVSLLKSIEKLFEAVKEKNCLNVETALKKGAVINSKNREGFTPLYYATCKGFKDIVGILLENKANPNAVDKNGFTALHFALKFSHLEITKMLLLNGASYNSETDGPITALNLSQHRDIVDLLEQAKIPNGKITPDMITTAVSKGDEECLKVLLARGTDVNKVGVDGRSLLHYAIHNGQTNVVKLLLSNGANVAQVTNKGNTPLHIAVSKNNKAIVDILLQHPSRCKDNEFIDAKTTNSGSTALHVAAKNNSLDIIKSLLENGAAYDATNRMGEIPCSLSSDQHVTSFLKLIENLFSYVKNGNSEAIQILKALNTDESLAATNTRNNEGHTLLQVAILNKRTNIATQLLNIVKIKKHITRE